MPKAESVIAFALMALAVYMMVHATVLPILWVEGSGPGGGAFPFWLSVILFLSAGGVFLRSLLEGRAEAGPFFDPETLRAVLAVAAAIVVTILMMSWLGAYVAFTAFLFWYLKIFGGHGWRLVGILIPTTLVFIFVFFEMTLRILLPKGVTEPFFVAFIYPYAF